MVLCGGKRGRGEEMDERYPPSFYRSQRLGPNPPHFTILCRWECLSINRELLPYGLQTSGCINICIAVIIRCPCYKISSVAVTVVVARMNATYSPLNIPDSNTLGLNESGQRQLLCRKRQRSLPKTVKPLLIR